MTENRLSSKTRRVYEFILDYITANGSSPTVREIARGCGFASPSTAQFHLEKLEKAGLITRKKRNSRSITPVEHVRPGMLIPLVGRIKAGQPATAEENIESYFSLPADIASRNSFLLRVSGDSMLEAGILDGDLVLVEPADTLPRGAIGAFLIGDEATIKYYDIIDGRPALVPANPNYSIIFPDNLTVLGRVVMLLRSYR